MRLFSGLHIGAESLYSHSTALNAVADNLANSNTPGYKSERPEFSDLLADSIGSLYSSPVSTGNGAKVEDTSIIYSQGAIDFTGRELDIAINGNGFFVVNNGENDFYTRSGNFTTDPDGNLITLQGDSVMGFTALSPDTLVPINVQDVTSTAAPTTTTALTGNLDTRVPPGVAAANPQTFIELAETSDFNTAIRVIDSLGQAHDVALHFFHTANNTWDVQAYVDGAEVGGVAGTPSALGTATLTFDANGAQDAANPTLLNVTPAWGNGAAAGAIGIDLSGFTGFASSSSVNSVSSDGTIPGSVIGVEIDEQGIVRAKLDNGEVVDVGTLALATFNSKDGLERVGETKFMASDASGEAILGAPGSSGLGALRGGALESSNVDASREFIDMIKYQRGYQAGSQIISTVNEILNTTIQLA